MITLKVVRHWNREVVYAPSPEVFKAQLDGGLSNPVYWEVALRVVGRLELHDL